MPDNETTENVNPTEQPTETPKEHVYTLEGPNGEVQTYKASTPEELLEKVNKAHNELFRHAKTVESENKRFRDSQPQTPPTQQPTTEGGSKFDQNKYFKLLAENPLEAADYLDQARGVNYKDWGSQMERFKKTEQAIEERRATEEFLSMIDDWPATPEAAMALQTKAEELVGRGFPLCGDTLYAAYQKAKRENLIQGSAFEPDPEPQPKRSRGANAPPPAGGAPAVENPSNDPWTMPLDKLGERIQQGGR